MSNNILTFFLILFQVAQNMMVFPFKQTFEKRNGDITMDNPIYNSTHYAKDYFKTQLYTEIKIGNPYQNLKILLSAETCAFKIGKSSDCIYSNEYLSYYNRNLSSDFNYTSLYSGSIHEFNGEKGSTAQDTIYAYTDINLKNEKAFKKVGFYLGSDTNDKLCGIIGLEQDNIICQRIYNIVKDCKSKKYINNRKFMLKYGNTINEGLFIIGSEFKDVIDNYDESQTFNIKSTNRVRVYRFGFEMTKAIIGESNETIDNNIIAEINNDLSFIIVGTQYLTAFNSTFFKEYIEKKICIINIYDNDPSLILSEKYSTIECNKEKFGENDLKKFPKFYFYVSNYYEEKKLFFDYTDLFTETKYKYFFNIIFDNSIRTKIDLGKIFLKKYPINFDYDNNILEIYDNFVEKPKQKKGGNDPDNLNNSNGNKMVIYILIIIILVGITGVVGYFLGKYLNKMRKKRANELLDEYDYQTDNQLVNDKDSQTES